MVARFKGTDSTFSSFPKRLEHVLSKSIDNVVTECIVFPEYEVSPRIDFSLLLRPTVLVGEFRPKANWYIIPMFNLTWEIPTKMTPCRFIHLRRPLSKHFPNG